MPKLVKNAAPAEHSWVTLRTKEEIENTDLSSGQWLLPFSEYVESQAEYADATKFGCWLASDADIETVKQHIANVQVIAIDFPAFADGRGFSLARTLREHSDYSGEIRAIGSFILDQVFYLSRCGFDAFEFGDEVELDKVIPFFSTFTETYQAGTDEPQPLFRRRA